MARRKQCGVYVACDIDMTLQAGDWHPQYKAQADGALEILTHAIIIQRQCEPGTPLYFGTATGRTLRSHREEVEAKSSVFRRSVAEMSLLIGSVGAEMALRTEDSFIPVQGWPGELSNWDRQRISRILQGMEGGGSLTLQEDMAQSHNKLSFIVEGAKGPHDEYTERLRMLLGSVGVEATVIFSGGMYLDILPRTADGAAVHKGTAIRFGAKLLAECDSLAEEPMIVFAGDSENDEQGFEQAVEAGGFGIVPGNAKDAFKRRMRDTYPVSQLYIARQAFGAGVQEGLEYFTILS